MKNFSSRSVSSKALVLALGVIFALPALAHAEFKGKFTLASETHWGVAVLEPGSYVFTLDSLSAPTKIVIRGKDGNIAAMLVSTWNSGITPPKINALELETRGSSTFVSAVYLKAADTELHFSIPKAVPAHEAKAPSTTMTASAQ